MTYSEKLKDPRWQRRRLEILARDEFSCRFCGADDSELHVHHLRYQAGAAPWDYPDCLLTTLCVVCHRDIEELKASIALKLPFEPSFCAFSDLLALLNSDDWMSVCALLRRVNRNPKLLPVIHEALPDT